MNGLLSAMRIIMNRAGVLYSNRFPFQWWSCISPTSGTAPFWKSNHCCTKIITVPVMWTIHYARLLPSGSLGNKGPTDSALRQNHSQSSAKDLQNIIGNIGSFMDHLMNSMFRTVVACAFFFLVLVHVLVWCAWFIRWECLSYQEKQWWLYYASGYGKKLKIYFIRILERLLFAETGTTRARVLFQYRRTHAGLPSHCNGHTHGVCSHRLSWCESPWHNVFI